MLRAVNRWTATLATLGGLAVVAWLTVPAEAPQPEEHLAQPAAPAPRPGIAVPEGHALPAAATVGTPAVLPDGA